MAKVVPVTIDLETFWSTTHSLSKMNPITYCMSPETEIISLSYKFNEDKSHCIFGEDKIRAWANQVDWSDKLVLGHNLSGFDAMILAWRLGIKPKMWGCTLAMARPVHAKTTGLSLGKLVEHYNIGVKDASILHNTKGKHLKDFSDEERQLMAKYNKDDVDQCWELFKQLLPLISKDEMKLIDMTVRMLVEPKFEVDTKLLSKTLKEEVVRKNKMLVDLATMIGAYENGMDDDAAAGAVCKTLGSAAKFGQLLRDLGVEVPTKISPTTGAEAPALAKTDEGFVALTEHEDPIVAAAAQARLGIKSTLLESRVSSFIEVASATSGLMPIALNYYGADTTGRWSGAMGLNQQNLPRVSKKPTDALRKCLRAPAGKKVVVADLSGIELRVNHFLWKVPSSMALYQGDPEKADLYKEFASDLYEVERSDVTKDQRQVGKVAHLGLGFGAGASTFQKVAKTMAGISLAVDDAVDVVTKWREVYKEIASGWRTCHDSLRYILAGLEREIDPWGMCRTSAEGIVTPKGIIRYPNLRQETNEAGKKEWFYGDGRHKARLHGPKCDENIVQHLARCVLADNALAIKQETGYNPVHTVHDELIYVVPEDDAEEHLATVQKHMRTPPSWWPELITWSEGDIASTYGDAK